MAAARDDAVLGDTDVLADPNHCMVVDLCISPQLRVVSDFEIPGHVDVDVFPDLDSVSNVGPPNSEDYWPRRSWYEPSSEKNIEHREPSSEADFFREAHSTPLKSAV